MPRRRTGTIVRCGDHYRARITLPDGKRPWIDLPPGLSEAMAREKAAALTELAHRGDAIYVGKSSGTFVGADETVSDWSKRWLETRKVRGLVSVRDDRFRLSTHILPVIGALPMALVTRAHLEDLVERLDAKSRTGTISWKTARHIWGLTTKMFHDATNAKNRSLRVRDTNPALGVAPPDRGVRKARTYLYPSEFLALVTCERAPLRWARIFTLASYLYVRAGELAGLEWEDVDLAHASVNVHRSLDLDAGHEKPTKGKASRRVPIHSSLMPLLKRMHAEAGGRGRVVKMPPREDLPRRLRTYLKWAGVTRAELFANDATRKQLTFHDLRGTGITWLAIAGTEPLKIKRGPVTRPSARPRSTSARRRTYGPASGSRSLRCRRKCSDPR